MEPESGWTVDTLLVYILAILNERDARFRNITTTAEQNHVDLVEQLRRETALSLAATKEAINKSESSIDKRFSNANEFRAQLGDQAKTFLPRAEYAAAHLRLEERMTDMGDRLNRSEGTGIGSHNSWIRAVEAVATIGALFGIVAVLLVILR